MPSIVFDWAVEFYDRTRADPDWVTDAVAEAFIRETGATRDSRILEVGIGTGRIAAPLLQRGLQVVGVDLSRAMMSELQKKNAGQAWRVFLAQADATALPFPDATFDVAYAVHVFHLVAGWQNAIAEVRRVLKPRGCLLVDFYGRNPESPIRKIRAHLRALVNARGVDTRRPGSQSDEELRAELDKWGAETRIAEVAQWQETFTPAQIIDALAARIHSETRLIPPEILAAVIPDLRAWAENEFGDLRKEVGEESQFSWLVVGKVSDD